MSIFKNIFGLVFAACVLTACTGDEVESATVPALPEHVVLYENQFTDLNDDPSIVEVKMVARNSEIEIYPGMSLQMLTYNGVFPGPLLEANVGDRVIVHFENQLDQPTTVHWHGLRIPDVMDGSPRLQDPVKPGEGFRYEFVVPDAGTYWYHPHVRSDEQVERGLYGPIIIRDPNEPQVDAERIIVVDDILLNAAGDGIEPFSALRFGMHGRIGNLLLGNGRADPGSVEHAPVKFGAVERWRILNTSNARTFVMTVDGTAESLLIGTDGGGVNPEPLEWLLVPVGQRYDVLVTHGLHDAAQLTAHLPAIENDEVVQVPVPIYRVPVAENDGKGSLRVTWPQRDLSEFQNRPVDREVEIRLAGYVTDTEMVWTINGMDHPMEPIFIVEEGETVLITLVNETGPEHPFHLHGQFFEIINEGTVYTDLPGLKDTVLVPGNTTIKIRAYMDNPGRWMAHCHILEHAELGMMAEILVEPALN